MNTNQNGTLRCVDLTRSFGGVHAVQKVSTEFHPGITALVGANGAGKTTLLHLLTGLIRADSGEMYLFGGRVDGLPAWKIARLGIGRLFQDVRVFGKLSVLDNVRVASPIQLMENPCCLFGRNRQHWCSENSVTDSAKKLLDFFELDNEAATLAENLSYGQQKLLALARLLATNARVLLLDEPTTGVNRKLIPKIIHRVRQLAAEGRTIVIIEHDIQVASELADRVVFMNDGRIVDEGDPQAVLSNPDVRQLYVGL